ncbi:hypothetical protein [Pontivivens insulae]|uniref:VOC domain-containing protein n=1 Tax=Pontivivens insulae TaxID=1639689 RepID=A0A2R8A668_9RHOB|nr:hypothetical protein [Pontivivens insulae]RED17841.1 hypothetical protein DFR53_0026 [Pontivivens insulae]SPF27731.1 hypothetical protein POI8812_00024 [Pontivivens insulae]
MTLLGIRFCHVAEDGIAGQMADALRGLGLSETDMGGAGDAFSGAVFPSEGKSWVELWAAADGMPAGTMLQFVVDDADAHADLARAAGLEPQGPMDMHGERIYHLTLPGGLPCAFLSARPAAN